MNKQLLSLVEEKGIVSMIENYAGIEIKTKNIYNKCSECNKRTKNVRYHYNEDTFILCKKCERENMVEPNCPCGTCNNFKKIVYCDKYFYGEGKESYRNDLCDKCHHYIKTLDYRNLEESDPFLEDIATLHLDVVAAQKGYERSVPNPWAA